MILIGKRLQRRRGTSTRKGGVFFVRYEKETDSENWKRIGGGKLRERMGHMFPTWALPPPSLSLFYVWPAVRESRERTLAIRNMSNAGHGKGKSEKEALRAKLLWLVQLLTTSAEIPLYNTHCFHHIQEPDDLSTTAGRHLLLSVELYFPTQVVL